jgi:dTDP-4-amino-4,6-dideoxygalactose transaminase
MSQSTDFVPFARPSLGEEEEEAVLEVLRSGWLTTGKVAKAFEEEFASFVGAKRALAVNSATSGLHLALEALGVGQGDLVATSPYTFTSTASVARHLGAEVAFCDVSKADYGIDPERLEELLDREPRIKAVLAIHVGGLPCRMRELLEICGRRGIPLVEDAAHAFPSRIPASLLPDGAARGRDAAFAGTLGAIGVYSFYATKTITTGEGGMVVTEDEALARRMATMRSHGFDRDAFDRYTSKTASWYYEVAEAGFKYNLPDLLAAIGREQLKKADRFLSEREAIARRYDEALAPLAAETGAAVPGSPPGAFALLELPPRGLGHSWHLYSLRLAGPIAGRRDEFFERLQAKGIGASVHFIPLHIMPYFAKRYGLRPSDFPEAFSKYSRTVSLPIWQGMAEDQVERTAEAVLETARELRAR